ncbi:hypothetical protein BDV98DRAFT_608190 [Pterulicium gracile]|uniref:NADAR domain-containing protein n=1 Tax=Pterulicium gracile TaxID=1884261 RepID=A0A5C3Q395_9AGAR|nr:hypothetical protein BDV98DRAFT_608190 [Pterula gracilis]
MGNGSSKHKQPRVYPGDPVPYVSGQGEPPVIPGVPSSSKTKKSKGSKKASGHVKASSLPAGFMPFTNKLSHPVHHHATPFIPPGVQMPVPHPAPPGEHAATLAAAAGVIPSGPATHPSAHHTPAGFIPPPFSMRPSAQNTPAVPHFTMPPETHHPSASGSRRAATPYTRSVQPASSESSTTTASTPMSGTPMHFDIYPPLPPGSLPPGFVPHTPTPGYNGYPAAPSALSASAAGSHIYRAASVSHSAKQAPQPVHPSAHSTHVPDQHPSPPNSNIFIRTRPPTPPQSTNTYGPDPQQRVHEPLSNPLPAPPRDLYEFTPYRDILSLPETTKLLQERDSKQVAPGVVDISASAPPGTVAAFSVSKAGGKKKHGGLFRGLSKRKKEDQQPETRYIYINASGSNVHGQDTSQGHSSSSHGHGHQRSQSQQSHHNAPPLSRTTSVHSNSISLGPSHHDPSTQTHIIPVTNSTPYFSQHKIYIDHTTPHYNEFLNHFPHRIMYRNAIYPTATHLFEAMKFIEKAPGRAEAIRRTESLDEVFALSEAWVREDGPEGAGLAGDWATVFLQKMEEVLILKFSQAPTLRSLLLHSGDSQLIYTDENDRFWGDGIGREGIEAGMGDEEVGSNQLGKSLMVVRHKLRAQEGQRGRHGATAPSRATSIR